MLHDIPLNPTDSAISSVVGRGAYLAARTEQGQGSDDCWLWKLKPDRDGYGVAHFEGKQWRAHRLSYTHYIGKIADGHELDHTCEVRLCVRPSHLQPVESNFENLVRKHLRRGATRAEAEEFAKWDQDQIQRDHEARIKQREAVAQAKAAGIAVGVSVRRGKTSSGPIWVVTGVDLRADGLVWLTLESSTSGRTDYVRLESVRSRPADVGSC